MMATHTNTDSKNIMFLIKPATIGAEIGVWMGNTSTQFLKKGLKKLYMIDAYSIEPYKNSSEMSFQEYLAKYQAITGEIAPAGFQKFYDRVYKQVRNTFDAFSEAELCKETSDEWFDRYKVSLSNGNPEHLDWIYIDGDHSYEVCLRDLENSLDVVKKDGIILGDDYYWPNAKWGKKGVTKAVNEFIDKHNFKMFKHGETQYEIRL